MSDDLEENFLSALRQVGYQSRNVKWMIDNEPTKDLIVWFSENIDSANYLSEEELNEYNEIKASGCVLEGADLDREIEEIIPDFEDLDGNEKEVLEHLKNEVAVAESYSSDMKDSLDALRMNLSSLDEQINQLENKNKAFENKFKKVQGIYYKNVNDLEASLRSLKEIIKDAVDYYNDFKQRVQLSKLIAEFPLEVYIEERKSVEEVIQRSIEELNLLDCQQKSSQSQIGQWMAELDDLKKRSEATRLLRLKQGAQRHAVEHSKAWLKQLRKDKSFWASLSSSSSIWKLTHDSMQRCLLLNQELGKLEDVAKKNILDTTTSSSHFQLWKKAKTGAENYASYQKLKVECVLREIILLRKNDSLQKIREIIKMEKSLCSKDLVLMMLLGDEVHTVFTTSQVISSLSMALRKAKIEGSHRLELMKSIKERRESEIQRIHSYPLLHFFSSHLAQYSKSKRPNAIFSSTLTENFMNENISSTLENLSNSSEILKTELERVEDKVLESANQCNLYVKLRHREELKLMKRVFCGPTSNKPMICPLKGLSLLHNFDKKDDDTDRKLKKLKKISSSKMSETSKMESKLWVLFYTNPSMLKDLLGKEEYESHGVL